MRQNQGWYPQDPRASERVGEPAQSGPRPAGHAPPVICVVEELDGHLSAPDDGMVDPAYPVNTYFYGLLRLPRRRSPKNQPSHQHQSIIFAVQLAEPLNSDQALRAWISMIY
jgi:hypothetical protein